ncbi:MAG: SEL1-like repeat protein [Parvularculaceae bacterium]|nr:SEL1-like repeat protein [Parvularculaceae bacterium]
MSAKSNVPWSVKGIDADARSVAKELARREGKTLGEWMTAMIRQKGLDEAGLAEDDQPSDKVISGVTTEQLRDVIGSLNRLNERIAETEKSLYVNERQAREAMGGLNKGLETVFERIKRLELEPGGSIPGLEPERIAEMGERLDRLEGGGKKSWVDSLKALERALTTLVVQVESSREETEERLSKNEDVLAALKDRLDADDEELRHEIGELLNAIDKTTERVSSTEERVTEALNVAREAAESHDETFIERTSNNLRLLGSEIKRTSDQIRGLESSVDKLQDKIEAGEQRSAEGISRVAQSLENLRHQVETSTLKTGDPSTATVRASVSEAEKRLGAVEGAFAAMVDQLEGRISTGPANTELKEPNATLDQAPQQDPFSSAPAADPLDGPMDDPLSLSPRQTPEPDPSGSGEPSASASPRLAPPFGGLTGPGTMAIGNAALAIDEEPFFGEAEVEPAATPAPTAAPEVRAEPERTPDQILGRDAAFDPAPALSDQDDDGFDWPTPEPTLEADDRPRQTFARDPLFDDEPTDIGEKFQSFLKSRFGRDVDNNPTLGWALLAIAAGSIAYVAVQFVAQDEASPVVMDVPTPQVSTGTSLTAAEPTQPSVATLYATAKEQLATASTDAERRDAVALLTSAAERGSSVAQHDLGELYLAGTDVPLDGLSARRWFRAAADNGHLPSVNRLAYLDMKGIGGPVDERRAIDGFTRAAQAGHTQAMVNLGTIYNPENAWLPSSQRNAAESFYWFRLAELRGDRSAVDEADQVASRLAPDIREAVEIRAEAWRPSALSR